MNLSQALQVAVTACLEAGEMLRRDFYAGPRGAGSHADIDDEIERLLRQRLLAQCPCAFLGEETGSFETEGEASRFRWLVDPNDGTSSYLQLWRGSAISVALLRDRQPVLGVVYAPLYPDDQGDLICWCEGESAILRNRQPQPRPQWGPLTSQSVVAVSLNADRSLGPYLKACHPARLRTLPSVAYRLALCAVGEVDAAVSLMGMRSFDVAAGHALVRAVGGQLHDNRGREFTYSDAGEVAYSSCFAGGSRALEQLHRSTWNIQSGHWEDDFPARPARPLAAHAGVSLDRVQGLLVGQLAGDSLGSLVEFRSASQIALAYPDGPRSLLDGGVWNILAGQPTDDSELALALARALLRRAQYDRDEVFASYREWVHSQPFDIGQATRSAFQDERPLQDTQANGSLMRSSPIALASWSEPLQAARWADQDSALSHPHPLCREACRVFQHALCAALRGAEREEIWRTAWEAGQLTRPLLDAARSSEPDDYITKMGWVAIAFQNAFFRLLHAPSLEEGLVATARCGGDSDTNACIAGALLGAYWGRSAVPAQWLRSLLSCRPSRDFAAAETPRPSCYWPADVLVLAERLATLPTPEEAHH